MHYNTFGTVALKNNEYDIWMDLKDALNISVLLALKNTNMIYEWI